MQDLGAYYMIVLNSPQLRRGLIAEAERSAAKARTSSRLRIRLAHALQALAIRLAPHESQAADLRPHQPVLVE